jgi:hypothetical protein
MVKYICVAFQAHRQSVSVPSARVRLNPYPALHIGSILARSQQHPHFLNLPGLQPLDRLLGRRSLGLC